MQIRPIEMEDADFLQRSEGNPEGWPSQRAWLGDQLAKPHIRNFIGHVNGYPICWGAIESRIELDADELRWKVMWPTDRGYGYGRLFARRLLEQTDAKRVYATIATDNFASMRIAISLGMKPEHLDEKKRLVFVINR